MISLVRPIQDASPIFVSSDDLMRYFHKSPEFFGLDNYSRDVMPLDGEIGFLAIVMGKDIYPVVRVCVKQ